MGKTSIVLKCLTELKAKGLRKVLVVGPLRVIYSSWIDEIAKWSTFQGLSAEIFHGKDPERIRSSSADIILVNFDYLRKLCQVEAFAKYHGFDGIIIDELTAFKSTASKRFKAMRRQLEYFKFRWGLTGSPTANSLEDVFGQAYMLDMGDTFGRFVTHFRAEYFMQLPYNKWKWVIRSDVELNRLNSNLAKLAMRMASEDYLDLPDFVDNIIKIPLTKEVYKQYKEMEEDFVTVVDNKAMSAVNKGVALNKCRQLCGGFILDSDKGQSVSVHDTKFEAIGNLMEELQGQPLLTFVSYRHEAEQLHARFANSEIIYGGTSALQSQKILDTWNKGELPLLIAHPASLGHGVNLQSGGHNMCWFSLPWDAELYLQANARLRRQGQTSTVMNHILMCPNTVDQYVYKVLRGKVKNQDEMFDSLVSMMKEREANASV